MMRIQVSRSSTLPYWRAMTLMPAASIFSISSVM